MAIAIAVAERDALRFHGIFIFLFEGSRPASLGGDREQTKSTKRLDIDMFRLFY
jgi:hypothetical protein